MLRFMLLTSVAVLALAAPLRAEEASANADTKTAFSQAIQSIKGWFGSDAPVEVTPITDTTTAMDDNIQVPPPVAGSPADIEPAAGIDEDTLQVPPPYYGPQSDATPRATSFDNNNSMAAFGNDASDLNAVSTAAGDGATLDRSKMDCAAILKAAEQAEEGDTPDAAMIEACKTPVDANAAAAAADPAPVSVETPKEPAQPAFEPAPASDTNPNPLPTTQPAAGEPAPATLQ